MCKNVCSSVSVKMLAIILICLSVFWRAPAIAGQLSDPTRPLDYKMAGKVAGIKSAQKWRLSSTLIARTRRLATINGKTVMLGQRIGKARVVAIEPTRVALLDNGKRIILDLLPRNFKRMR